MTVGYGTTPAYTVTRTESFFPASRVEHSFASRPDPLKMLLLSMLKDDDIVRLPPPLQEALRGFSIDIASAILVPDNVKMAIFGDPEEGVGEIVVTDLVRRCEMQVVVRGAEASFWIRSDARTIEFDGDQSKVPIAVAVFQIA